MAAGLPRSVPSRRDPRPEGERDRGLDERDVDPDPIGQFHRWFADAKAADEPQPEAMALATATPGAAPSVRYVLLRGLDERGFVFYTNERSRKGQELIANPCASLAFRWWILERQVRVEGTTAVVDPGESDAYFATRPRGAQLGAWASAQSEALDSRVDLENSLETVTARFAGRDVSRPPWWGGFRVEPSAVEFWQGRPDRLHDRLRYTRDGAGWGIRRLSP
jgi:pyridoxamine 5'-phosphate oxidase